MTSSNDDLREQLDYLAGLAERGRMVPLLSGAYFVVWGVIVGIAGTVAHLAIGHGAGRLAGAVWAVAVAIGWVTAAAVGRRLKLRSRDGTASYGNEVTRVVWLTAGLSITGYLIAAELSPLATTSVTVVALLVSGMAIVASASASATRLLYVSGAGLILLALGDVAFGWSSSASNLVVAAAGVLFLAIPGIVLVLRSREPR